MFGRKKNEQAGNTPEPVVEEDKGKAPGAKKGPTPSRREQEAKNRRPLVGGSPAVSKQRERERRAAEAARIREGMRTGDERYLLARDKGPQRRYAREFIDARTSIGETLLIVVVLFLVTSLLMSSILPPEAQANMVFIMWIYLFIVIVDGIWASRQLKKRLLAKFGEVQKGTMWYAFMRALQFRPMRQPKPQNKRGHYPD